MDERKWGISGSTLKLIAITAMLIDHIGAVFLVPYLNTPGNFSQQMYEVYYVMRLIIGRAAFPIFCFLLTEGFQRTSNVAKYALRLGVFALVSEIPFDLAFSGVPMDWEDQNVFFTLFLGLLGMIAIRAIWDWEGVPDKAPGWVKALVLVGKALLCVAAALVCMKAADLLHTDYHSYGVFCILVLYVFRRWRLAQAAAGCAAFWIGDSLFGLGGTEALAPIGLVPVLLYNGKRGLRLKYVFYLFYPIHLLILAGLFQVLF